MLTRLLQSWTPPIPLSLVDLVRTQSSWFSNYNCYCSVVWSHQILGTAVTGSSELVIAGGAGLTPSISTQLSVVQVSGNDTVSFNATALADPSLVMASIAIGVAPQMLVLL